MRKKEDATFQMPKNDKQNLSKGLLNMKFMKRYNETELRKKLQSEQESEQDKARWVLETPSKIPTVTYMQETTFEFPTDSRSSFLQFNPDVEKYVQAVDKQKAANNNNNNNNNDNKSNIPVSNDEYATISDKDMAIKMGKESVKKRKRNSKTIEVKKESRDMNYYSRKKKFKQSLE